MPAATVADHEEGKVRAELEKGEGAYERDMHQSLQRAQRLCLAIAVQQPSRATSTPPLCP